MKRSTFAAFAVSLLPLSAQTWQPTADTPGPIQSGASRCMTTDGTHLYVLGQNGIYRTTDGSSWQTLNTVAGTFAYDMGTALQDFIEYANGKVWVGNDPGSLELSGYTALHRLEPGATAWTRSVDSGFPGTAISSAANSIAYDSSTGRYFVGSALGGVYTSTDGVNWTRGDASGIGSSIFAKNGAALLSLAGGGLRRSTDGGATWTNPGVPGGNQGELFSLGERVFFPTSGANTLQAGLYTSPDLGATWIRLTGTHTPTGAADVTTDDSLAFSTSGYNFLSNQQILAFSSTGGVTWDPLPGDGLAKAASFPPTTAAPAFVPQRVIRHGGNLFIAGHLNAGSSGTSLVNRLYRISLADLDLAPTLQIAVQPQGGNLRAGGELRLEALAGGKAPLSYQWKKNGGDLPGRTSPTLVIPDARPSDDGDYTLTVTDADGASLSTSIAAVRVFPSEPGRYDPLLDRTGIGATSEHGDLYPAADGSVAVFQSNYAFRIGPDGGITGSRGNFGGSGSSGPSYPVRLHDSQGRFLLFPKASPATNWRAIRRLHGTGDFANDTSFPALIPNGTIDSVCELPGRGYLVAGSFTQIGDTPVNRLAVISYDGASITPYAPALPSGSLGNLHYSPADNSVWLTGAFHYNPPPYASNPWPGSQTQRLVKLDADGNLAPGWTPFTLSGPSTYPTILAVQPDGKVLLREGYTITRLNADGTRDTSFNTAGLSFSPANSSTTFNQVALQPDGKILVAGSFNAFGPHAAAGRYCRLHSDGTFDETFYCASGSSSSVPVNSLVYDPRGYVYLSHATAATSATFQGVAGIGRGVVRLFATAPSTQPPDSPSAVWLSSFTFPAGEGDWTDDPDKDGIPTLLEYFLGSSPVQNNPAGQPRENGFTEIAGETYFTIRFTRSTTATDLSFQVRAATDLDFTSDLGTTLVSETHLGNDLVESIHRSNLPISATARQFMRVEVTLD